MGEHDSEDLDRAAILARRRRFIALALGGLATGCAPGKPAPTPEGTTTKTSSGTTTGTTNESGEGGSGSDSGSETAPQACLKFDLPPEPDLPPADESGSDESDSGTDSGTTGPRPCLAPPGTLP